MPRGFDAIVIGAGVHGASVALSLSRKGLQVALIERDRLGSHASGVNAGSIHHIPRIHFELPLAEVALRSWEQMNEWLDDDCGFRRVGYLRVVTREHELPDVRRSMARVQRYSNIPEQLLDRRELDSVQPGLSEDAIGGIWAPSCGYAVPAHTMNALRRNLQAAGTCLFEGARVDTIEKAAGHWTCVSNGERWSAPILVNCAGAWGAAVAGLVGERMLISPVALMMTVTGRADRLLDTVLGLHGQRLSMKQPENGTLLIGGGYQGAVVSKDWTTRLDPQRLAYNLALAKETLPSLGSVAVVRSWAGIEGMTPDHAPYIGPSLTHDGLWHCAGFSTHGFYLGPVTGQLLADAIVSDTVPDLLRPFALDRITTLGPQSPKADIASPAA